MAQHAGELRETDCDCVLDAAASVVVIVVVVVVVVVVVYSTTHTRSQIRSGEKKNRTRIGEIRENTTIHFFLVLITVV